MTLADEARAALVSAVEAGADGLENFIILGEALSTGAVSRFELVDAMAGQVLGDVNKHLRSLESKQFIDYDPSYQTSPSQVLVEALTEIPALNEIDMRIRAGDVPLVAETEDFLAMVHMVSSEDHQAVAYRLKGPGTATRRKMWPMVPRSGVYGPVSDHILYYEPRFDAVTCAGFAFFSTATLIQTKLEAGDKARRLARETFQTVTAELRIDGRDELEQAVVDDPALRNKMSHVARLVESDAEYAEKVTMRNLVTVVEDNPDYGIPLSTVDGQKALKFDPSPQHRHQIPRLLADDYLLSQLTDRRYEAGSKQRV